MKNCRKVDIGHGRVIPLNRFNLLTIVVLIVDKHARTLFGKSWSLYVPKEIAWTIDYLDRVYAMNDKDEFSLELAKQGGMTGDAFVHVPLDLHPAYDIPYVKLTIIPSTYMHPITKRTYGIGKKIIGYKIIYAE